MDVADSPAELDRLRLYAYATAGQSAEYVAIMRLFAGALLAEWSAHDVVEHGVDLPVDVIEQRLRYLEANGNLLASPQEVRVTSIAEYQRQPARYAATSSACASTARSRRSSPPPAARGVPRVARRGRPPAHGARRLGPDGITAIDPADWPRRLHRVLAVRVVRRLRSPTSTRTSVRCSPAPTSTTTSGSGSSASCSTTWRRSSMPSPATPAPSAALDALDPSLPTLVDRLADAEPDLERVLHSSPGGEGIERSRGRAIGRLGRAACLVRRRRQQDIGRAATPGRGGTGRRGAAGQRQADERRSSRETSLRQHFLRLAGWFDTATPTDAHVLYTRRSPSTAPATSRAPRSRRRRGAAGDHQLVAGTGAPVPVSIRERGDRNPRGRVVRHQRPQRREAPTARATRRATTSAEAAASPNCSPSATASARCGCPAAA